MTPAEDPAAAAAGTAHANHLDRRTVNDQSTPADTTYPTDALPTDHIAQADAEPTPAGEGPAAAVAGVSVDGAEDEHDGVRMEAGDLADLLNALVVCTSSDDDFDTLTHVRLESTPGRLAGTATDQFVLGRAYKSARGTLAGPVMLPAAAGRRFLADLADVDRAETVYLNQSGTGAGAGNRLVLQTTRGLVGCYLPDPPPAYPAGLAELLSADGYDEIGLTGMVAFAPRMLAVVHAATEAAGEHEARLYFRSPTKPLRVEISDWLVILIMPMGSTDRRPLPARPSIPYALPDAPAHLGATADEPTAVGWPRALEEATPRRLARHYAAHYQAAHRRVFDAPWPASLPPWDQQDEVQRRISTARADAYAFIVNSYTVSLLIRRFAAAAPAAAAAACRELWEDLDYGDSLGEKAWEWLQADKIDPSAVTVDPAERDAQALAILIRAYATPPPADDPLAGQNT